MAVVSGSPRQAHLDIRSGVLTVTIFESVIGLCGAR